MIICLLVVSNNNDEIDELKGKLGKNFEVKDLCPAKQVFGMENFGIGKWHLVTLAKEACGKLLDECYMSGKIGDTLHLRFIQIIF